MACRLQGKGQFSADKPLHLQALPSKTDGFENDAKEEGAWYSCSPPQFHHTKKTLKRLKLRDVST